MNWIKTNKKLPEDYQSVIYFDSRDKSYHVGYFVPSQSKIPNYIKYWIPITFLPEIPDYD